MRRFEFVEGGSAKFWEIRRDGNEVTVRWGRVGTNGQSKAKGFDDPAAATTHETRLIAEKLRKGYLEAAAATAGAPVVAPVPSAPVPSPPVPSAPVEVDEDTFVFPPAWYRHRYARHTSVGVGRFVPDPNARAVAEEEATRRPGTVQRILEAPTTPGDVRAAGFAWR